MVRPRKVERSTFACCRRVGGCVAAGRADALWRFARSIGVSRPPGRGRNKKHPRRDAFCFWLRRTGTSVGSRGPSSFEVLWLRPLVGGAPTQGWSARRSRAAGASVVAWPPAAPMPCGASRAPSAFLAHPAKPKQKHPRGGAFFGSAGRALPWGRAVLPRLKCCGCVRWLVVRPRKGGALDVRVLPARRWLRGRRPRRCLVALRALHRRFSAARQRQKQKAPPKGCFLFLAPQSGQHANHQASPNDAVPGRLEPTGSSWQATQGASSAVPNAQIAHRAGDCYADAALRGPFAG